MDASHNLICAVLRHEEPCRNAVTDAASAMQLLAVARQHGVLPLLAMEIRGHSDVWPEAVVAACREAERNQAIHELAHHAADRRLLDALSSCGVNPLVLKGSALAYTLYPNPVLRPRSDTDLLIPAGQRPEAERTLGRLGYARREATEGQFISYQATWTRSDTFGAAHPVDLHWRINNSQILARTAGYDELATRATRVNALGPNVRTPCLVDALLLACMHRAGHVHAPYYVDGIAGHAVDRLIWLYDIHLLVSALSAEELDEFAALAAAKRIKAICRDGLLGAQACLGTPIPAHTLESLSVEGPAEPSAACLTASRMRLMIEDFRALECWADRMGWMRELAFPSARYVRGKYPEAAVKWLPVLYLRRGLTGISRLITHRDAGHTH